MRNAYIIKYRMRGRRYSFVRGVELEHVAYAGLPYVPRLTVHYAADAATVPSFTRADARRTVDAIRSVDPALARRMSVIPRAWYREGADGKLRVIPKDMPRGTVDLPGELDADFTPDGRALLDRARAAGHDVPDNRAILVWVLGERARGSRGGRWGVNLGVAIHRFEWISTRPGYLTYTVAHELAHAMQVHRSGRTDHGPEFMAILRELCPPEFIAYELEYKPQAAMAAGISCAAAPPQVQAALRVKRRPGPTFAEFNRTNFSGVPQ